MLVKVFVLPALNFLKQKVKFLGQHNCFYPEIHSGERKEFISFFKMTHTQVLSHRDHFRRLPFTTGTILSVGSLIHSDWIHCSAVLMDVL